MNLRVIKTTRLTEKSVIQKEMSNQVTFMVSKEANKIEIKKTIEKVFKVTVLNVNTINNRGKKKRMGRFTGRRPDWKKAIVTLRDGDKIDLI